MKISFSTTVLVLISSFAFSQSENDKKILMDSLWNETTNVDYMYYRIVKDYNLEKSNYKILDYYKNGVLQMEGTTEDKLGTLKVGEFIYYYENGNKKLYTNYLKGREIGNRIEWYENGNKKLEGEYIEDEKKSKRLKTNQFWNKEGKQIVINGNGEYEFNSEYTFQSGKIKDGFNDGVCIYNDKKKNTKHLDTFKDGKLVSGITTDAANNKIEYFEIEKMPAPKRGFENFYKYIWSHFKYSKASLNVNIKGKIIVKFVVDENGEIVEPKIIKGLGYGLDEEAIRVISNYGKWIPGEKRGIKTRCYFSIPISLVVN